MNDKIDKLLEKLQHKDKYKSTTTYKFKKDLANILLNRSFEGDILEIGTNTGNTTALLGFIGDHLNKKVYSIDISFNLLKQAQFFLDEIEIDNVELIQTDVYKYKNEIKNIGFVFIDCIHDYKHFAADMQRSEKQLTKNGFIVAHDYGLSNHDGDGIRRFLSENSEKYKIEKFIGEKDGWNKNGTGTVIDYEAVLISINKDNFEL